MRLVIVAVMFFAGLTALIWGLALVGLPALLIGGGLFTSLVAATLLDVSPRQDDEANE